MEQPQFVPPSRALWPFRSVHTAVYSNQDHPQLPHPTFRDEFSEVGGGVIGEGKITHFRIGKIATLFGFSVLLWEEGNGVTKNGSCRGVCVDLQ